MKKNIVFVVDSYFQFIVAANLKSTIYKEDDVDVVLYNSSQNVAKIYKNIKELCFFNNVYLAETPLLFCGSEYSITEKIEKYVEYLKTLINPLFEISRIKDFPKDKYYDLFIFNSFGALSSSIFNICYKNNSKIRCLRIEEGGASYINEYHKKRLLRLAFERLCSIVFRTKIMTDYVDGLYFFEPSLVQFNPSYPILQMPKISRSNTILKDFLSKVFDFKNISEVYDCKYVIFEDGETYFSNSNDDLDIIVKTADVVGRENVIIKLHPRRKENRFKKYNIKVNNTVGIPWEVIMLNIDFKDKVFITSLSGAALTSLLYFDDNCRVIFNYKCMQKLPKVAESPKYNKYLNSLIDRYGEERFVVVADMASYLSLLKSLL